MRAWSEVDRTCGCCDQTSACPKSHFSGRRALSFYRWHHYSTRWRVCRHGRTRRPGCWHMLAHRPMPLTRTPSTHSRKCCATSYGRSLRAGMARAACAYLPHNALWTWIVTMVHFKNFTFEFFNRSLGHFIEYKIFIRASLRLFSQSH